MASADERRHWIGASECSAVVGVHDWLDKSSLWLLKKGLRAEFNSERADMGKRMEPIIRSLYEERTGFKCRGGQVATQHRKEKWAGCTPDDYVFQNGGRKPVRLVEYKNVGFDQRHKFGRAGTDEVPPRIRCQVQWQMWVTGLEIVDVAVLFGGNHFEVFHVERDAPFLTLLIEANRAFWFDHVVADEPPDDISEKGASAIARYLFPEEKKGRLVNATEESEAWAARVLWAQAQMAKVESVLKESQVAIQLHLGDAECMIGSNWRATWRKENGRVSYADLYEETLAQMAEACEAILTADHQRAYEILLKAQKLKESYRGNPIRVFSLQPKKEYASDKE